MRNDPDMPRWQISSGPPSVSMVRYLARLPSETIRWPASRSEKTGEKGNRRAGRRVSAERMRAPSITGCKPRLTVSTSGSSGMAGNDLVERGAVGAGRQAEMGGDRLAHVGESRAQSDISARQAGRAAEDRHPLARMVGAGPCRVAAMVGGEKQEDRKSVG